MGTVYAELILKNAWDVDGIWRGQVAEQDVRQVTVRATVDTGAGTLVIGEDICQKLGLTTKGPRRVTLAGGEHLVARVTEPVEIHWGNRFCACNALVLPGEHEVLLGAHGDEAISMVKRLNLTHGFWVFMPETMPCTPETAAFIPTYCR